MSLPWLGDKNRHAEKNPLRGITKIFLERRGEKDKKEERKIQSLA